MIDISNDHIYDSKKLKICIFILYYLTNILRIKNTKLKIFKV